MQDILEKVQGQIDHLRALILHEQERRAELERRFDSFADDIGEINKLVETIASQVPSQLGEKLSPLESRVDSLADSAAAQVATATLLLNRLAEVEARTPVVVDKDARESIVHLMKRVEFNRQAISAVNETLEANRTQAR